MQRSALARLQSANLPFAAVTTLPNPPRSDYSIAALPKVIAEHQAELNYQKSQRPPPKASIAAFTKEIARLKAMLASKKAAAAKAAQAAAVAAARAQVRGPFLRGLSEVIQETVGEDAQTRYIDNAAGVSTYDAPPAGISLATATLVREGDSVRWQAPAGSPPAPALAPVVGQREVATSGDASTMVDIRAGDPHDPNPARPGGYYETLWAASVANASGDPLATLHAASTQNQNPIGFIPLYEWAVSSGRVPFSAVLAESGSSAPNLQTWVQEQAHFQQTSGSRLFQDVVRTVVFAAPAVVGAAVAAGYAVGASAAEVGASYAASQGFAVAAQNAAVDAALASSAFTPDIGAENVFAFESGGVDLGAENLFNYQAPDFGAENLFAPEPGGVDFGAENLFAPEPQPAPDFGSENFFKAEPQPFDAGAENMFAPEPQGTPGGGAEPLPGNNAPWLQDAATKAATGAATGAVVDLLTGEAPQLIGDQIQIPDFIDNPTIDGDNGEWWIDTRVDPTDVADPLFEGGGEVEPFGNDDLDLDGGDGGDDLLEDFDPDGGGDQIGGDILPEDFDWDYLDQIWDTLAPHLQAEILKLLAEKKSLAPFKPPVRGPDSPPPSAKPSLFAGLDWKKIGLIAAAAALVAVPLANRGGARSRRSRYTHRR